MVRQRGSCCAFPVDRKAAEQRLNFDEPKNGVTAEEAPLRSRRCLRGKKRSLRVAEAIDAFWQRG